MSFQTKTTATATLYDHQKNMIASGLNWRVEKRPIYDGAGKKLRVEGTFRSDNDHFLGAVTPGYRIVDNEELFRYPEELVKAGENVEFAGAGALLGGEGVYVKYKLPHVIDVKKVGDIMETELVISTKHNGKGSVIAAVNSKLLICTNGMMTSDRSFVNYVRHSASASARLTDAREAVGYIGVQVKQFGQLCNCLADVKLNTEDISEIVNRFYYKDEKSNIQTSAQKQNQARAILLTYEDNDGNTFKSQRGTAWNMLNAFTNFADHQRTYRIGREENEVEASDRGKLFGAGQAMKFQALQIIATVIHKNHSINLPESYLLND